MNAEKAEPGRDIFARPPKADVKNQNNVVPSVVEENEPKAISTVGVSLSSEALPDEKAPATPADTDNASTASPNGVSSSSPVDALSLAESEVPKAKKVQGPMDAEQAEADEVRQELFPDAHA